MVAIRRLATTLTTFVGSLTPKMASRSDGCDHSNISIPLSSAQLADLGHPNTPLVAVGAAFGVQNYTCTSENKFQSTGAVAEIVDITHIAVSDSSRVLTFTKDLFQVWNSAEMVGDTTIQEFIETLPKSDRQILGQHYFIDNAAGELAPVWDFRDIQKFKGNQQAVFVGKVLESAPNADPGSVPLSHLGKVSGDILDEVFGILTIGGVPPSSCTHGDSKDISVKYAAQYWLYGGSLGFCSG